MPRKNRPTTILFIREENGLRFEWQGGAYIDILSRNKLRRNQEEALWIDNATMREPGWYMTDQNIGVWDYSKDKPTIPRTEKAFDKEVDEWLKENQ